MTEISKSDDDLFTSVSTDSGERISPISPAAVMNKIQENIYRVLPYYYLHILDQTTNVTQVVIGPKTYVRKNNEFVVLGPEKMVIVPPCHYCIVLNPVVRAPDETLIYDAYGQVNLKHADFEIRFEQEPFPLYPGEVLHQDITPLTVLSSTEALHLKAIRGFENDLKRIAGEEWLFEGPGTYIPHKDVQVLKILQATIIKPDQALKLRARAETKDRDGRPRVTGEEWLVQKVGSYLPGAYEKIVEIVEPYVLTEKTAAHVQALKTFVDRWGKQRKNGEEWLVTLSDTETYIPDVYENVLRLIEAITLTNRQYCVILDPVGEDGKNQYGKKKLVKGEQSFFLQPGESLENMIESIQIISEKEGLILSAKESFLDTFVEPPLQRNAGDTWMIKGPAEYIPPIEVEILRINHAFALDDNEGVYVRNTKTGQIRVVCGTSYMLTQDEELWKKELPPKVAELVESNIDIYANRAQYRMAMCEMSDSMFKKKKVFEAIPDIKAYKAVIFKVPHNAAVQIYDFREKKARVVFGPELVMLGPDEQFTQLSLSGEKPKRPSVIQTLCLLLGPDFCTDLIIVETADHARLSLKLSYNWHFDVGDKSEAFGQKIFNVPDFVGDLCKALASSIRGVVASTNFDDFHKNSAKIIRSAVFGTDANGKVKDSFIFSQNNLCITSVDIQNVEPVDERTREALQKSVQMAIEITTHSQEATAMQEAERREQEARGCLERQKILDEIEAEKARKQLLELKVSSKTLEQCGTSKAEALGIIEAEKLKIEASIDEAQKKAEVKRIETESELERKRIFREIELKHTRAEIMLQIQKNQKLAEIGCEKFKNMVNAIGQDTIKTIAMADSELQVKLLQGLGIQSTLITDGNTPINLFKTAEGLIERTSLDW